MSYITPHCLTVWLRLIPTNHIPYNNISRRVEKIIFILTKTWINSDSFSSLWWVCSSVWLSNCRGCLKCLIIYQKHYNVLQYRESKSSLILLNIIVDPSNHHTHDSDSLPSSYRNLPITQNDHTLQMCTLSAKFFLGRDKVFSLDFCSKRFLVLSVQGRPDGWHE